MPIRLIQVPYDSGHQRWRMGQGPVHLIEHGLVHRLEEAVGRVEVRTVQGADPYALEIATTFETLREISREVRKALESEELPLVLAGNCNSTIGALGGCAAADPALIWFDCHGDLNTPETSTSGFLDGMSLAMATGGCWRSMARSVPGFQPLDEERVALVGARDLDDAELERLERSAITWIRPDDLKRKGAETALAPLLDRLARIAGTVYLHFDMDVHDPEQAPVNPYQTGGGLSPEEMQQCVGAISAEIPIVGASLTSYDPDADVEDRGLKAGIDLLCHVAEVTHE